MVSLTDQMIGMGSRQFLHKFLMPDGHLTMEHHINKWDHIEIDMDIVTELLIKAKIMH